MNCPHCQRSIVGIEDECPRCGGVVIRATHTKSNPSIRVPLEYSIVRPNEALEEQKRSARAASLAKRQRIALAVALVGAAVICGTILIVFSRCY